MSSFCDRFAAQGFRLTPLHALLLAIALASFADLCTADDWPQFRGVHRDGRSAEAGIMQAWPEQGPDLLWTAQELGIGYSSVAVVGDRVFTIGDVGDTQIALALDASDGSLVWKQPIGRANSGSYPGSRSTPTFDQGSLYCLTTDGMLLSLDAKNGKVRWQRDLASDYGASLMQAMGTIDWRFSESPLVDGSRVIVTPGSSAATMVALDSQTGDELWRTAIPDLGPAGADGAGYSSAVVSEACGVRQYVQLIGRGLISVEAETGKLLWSYNRIANDIANISSPVISGDFVFASTGYQTGSALLKIVPTANGQLSAEEQYFLDSRTFQNHHGGFVLHDGYIFGGHGHKMGLPICVRLDDGKVMWGPKRNKGSSSAACSYANGQIYLRYQDGLMVLVDASPDEYRERSSFMIPDVRAESWSHPVIAGGRLFLKEQDRLLCYDIATSGASSR